MYGMKIGLGRLAGTFATLLTCVLLVMPAAVTAQSYRSGQHVEPAFEGWRPNPDGTFSFMFGYMNEKLGRRTVRACG